VDGFLLLDDPLNISSDPQFPFQPAEGIKILEEIGWIDHDQDPATARVASGIAGVKDGTVFHLSLLVAGSETMPVSADNIQNDLGDCGIEVEIELIPATELLAPGPDGPIFGRQFDLALFAWSTGSYHLCQLFITDEIPGIYPGFPKGWGGTNASGYSNQNFDDGCSVLLTSLPDSEKGQNALKDVQAVFAEDLPVLPLFFRHQVIISDPDLRGFNSGVYSPFWNMEMIR
jgi:peptide/nickel transport system substrate-binding protein